MVDGCCDDDSLRCDGLGKCCSLSDCGAGHGHVDCRRRRRRKREDDRCVFAIDVEREGRRLGIDDGRQSHEGQTSGGGKHVEGNGCQSKVKCALKVPTSGMRAQEKMRDGK